MEDALFDIEPAGRIDAGAPVRFRVVARNTDPETSHEAAASVSQITETHERILRIFSDCYELTDEHLATEWLTYGTHLGWPPISPSGLRSRRAELVARGKLRDSGRRSITRSNRSTIIWEICS